MTTASHGHAAAAHDAAHDYDGEPVRELAADEPPTPGWLPSLGLALFLVGGVAYLTLGDDTQEAAAAAAAASASAAVVAAVAPTPPPQPLQAAPQGQPQIPPGVRNITPQQRADLQKRLDAMKAQRGQGAPPPPPH